MPVVALVVAAAEADVAVAVVQSHCALRIAVPDVASAVASAAAFAEEGWGSHKANYMSRFEGPLIVEPWFPCMTAGSRFAEVECLEKDENDMGMGVEAALIP